MQRLAAAWHRGAGRGRAAVEPPGDAFWGCTLLYAHTPRPWFGAPARKASAKGSHAGGDVRWGALVLATTKPRSHARLWSEHAKGNLRLTKSLLRN